MTRQELIDQIKLKKSFLCVGLDTDLAKIPPHLLETEDPVFEFNKAIIDATKEYCVAYKPNIAFYPKAVGFLIRQVFWLVLLKVILPKLLQWN